MLGCILRRTSLCQPDADIPPATTRKLKVFRHYAEQEQDPDLKAFASKADKMLSQHVVIARKTGEMLQSQA